MSDLRQLEWPISGSDHHELKYTLKSCIKQIYQGLLQVCTWFGLQHIKQHPLASVETLFPYSLSQLWLTHFVWPDCQLSWWSRRIVNGKEGNVTGTQSIIPDDTLLNDVNLLYSRTVPLVSQHKGVRLKLCCLAMITFLWLIVISV